MSQRIDFSKFRPVQFEFGKVHFRGGLLAKALPLISKTVRLSNGKEETFVKLGTRETWLIQATTGNSKYNGSSFGRTSLLDVLHSTTRQYCDGELAAEDAATDAEAAAADLPFAAVAAQGDDHDPMAEIDDADSQGQSPPTKLAGNGVKRARYYKNHNKGKVVTVSLPERCAEEEPNCVDVRNIKLYIEDRKQLWVAMGDVAWVVQILYVQNLLKGVPLIPEDSAGPGGAPGGA